MNKKPIELSDLPPEMLQLLVEKCDFITRRRLRASSSLMYQVVNSTKLYIPLVKILHWNTGVLVELSVEPFKGNYILEFKKTPTGGTQISSNYREEILIEISDPMDEAIDFFRQMCLQKNVTIGQFHLGGVYIDTIDMKKLTQKLDGVLRESEIPVKIKSILCERIESEDLMWKIMDYCDKRLLKEMKVRRMFPDDDIFELFGKQDEIVKNLEKIEIECLCNVSDEDVLSLNASVISLKSDNFTVDLVYKLIEKFINRREDGSAFCIENSQKRNLDLGTIPPGFKKTDSTNEYKEYRNQLINTNHPTVYLRVREDRVRLQIGDTKKANFWIEDESDSDTSDDSDSIPGWDMDMDYDEYEGDFDPDDYDYENAFDQDYDYFDDDFFWD
ncbi:hypothetical protein GCK72_002713 [Caenorhabditis remanei]|uniref:F-box domain-containing protein n=2 Tax=Caenorhabditis remanei TaxID=31234 RepID=A0A6A5HT36_CAERE|nr:hypothetical protein GCK72_002713 [Caenorhabditis remanei]KAF1770889.1 hypothetical protein GCK72_002713 [Caenorhabditis remanei]